MGDFMMANFRVFFFLSLPVVSAHYVSAAGSVSLSFCLIALVRKI